MTTLDAIAPLYAYQKAWLADGSPLKAGLWARSSGKTHAVMLEAVIDCWRAEVEGRRTNWFVFSGAAGQTVEMLRYAAMHAQAIGTAVKAFDEDVYVEGQRFSQQVVEFEGGSRIVGLPTNPLTIRGRHGNLIWDEAGKTPHAEEIWSSAMPIAGRTGFKIRVVGTPGPKSGPFYQMMSPDSAWSKHKVDVYQAIADGAPLDVEKIKAAVGAGKRWRTEYLVEFEDEGERWLALDLICACEDEHTLVAPFTRVDSSLDRDWKPLLDPARNEEPPSEGYDQPLAWRRFFSPLVGRTGRKYLGLDVARHRDLTVIWIVEPETLVRRTRVVLALHRRRFAEQRAALWAALEHCDRGCLDAGGLGEQLAEETVERFGPHKVEAVKFTAAVKEDLAVRMLRSFEDRSARIPPASAVRDSHHAVYKVTTVAGNARFDADSTEEAGHADYFWAHALAQLAAGDGARGVPLVHSAGVHRYRDRAGGVF